MRQQTLVAGTVARVMAVVMFGFSPSLLAQPQDIPNSKDHPLVSRYRGSYISFYAVKEFEEYRLVVGRVTAATGTPKFQPIEGKITRAVYVYPQERSSLEVFRNYQSALKQAGFDTAFECSGDCGLSRFSSSGDWYDMWVGPADRQFTGKLRRPEGDVYVSVHVSENKYVTVDVIEPKPLEAGLVTVNASALASDITRTGHTAVYGIYFDTGKAEVKSESGSALKEIAALMRQDPRLRLYVVGHTDNTGELAANMDLSKRRADAVLKALATQYGVPADRLQAFGSGPLAPVASNKTEEGRAKNRRVELVER